MRFSTTRGTNSRTRKLTERQVYRIRRLYDRGITGRERAKFFGISRNQYNEIGKRRSWAHLPERQIKTKEQTNAEA